MRFFSFLFVNATLIGFTFAQGIAVSAPIEGATVKAGSNITVQVDGPLVKQGSIQAAVVIGLLSCSPPCPSPAQEIGKILYNGPYFPTIHFLGPGPAGTQIFENLTVAIPAFVALGPAQLSVTQTNLLNDGSHLVLRSSAVTVLMD
ncbi:hypothetical protein C8F04DRAFT_1306396 [Mycena alexandri]|uniref:Uncharacterized protein n=1 Tax=Mycena alexandri TaxID=1745969 RepID=A0AAD6S8E1_9AGAR|nr:hypothetical protein C8F04DRAFT_1306396 [Mycena alexandri]